MLLLKGLVTISWSLPRLVKSVIETLVLEAGDSGCSIETDTETNTSSSERRFLLTGKPSSPNQAADRKTLSGQGLEAGWRGWASSTQMNPGNCIVNSFEILYQWTSDR